MNWNWRHLVGLGLFLALFCAALIANVSDSSMSHVRGVAYPVHALEVSFETFRSGARVFAHPRPELEARSCAFKKRSALAKPTPLWPSLFFKNDGKLRLKTRLSDRVTVPSDG
jgi:hypothetical protein